MTKKLLIGAATALSVLGIFGQGMAGAAPAPAYTVACAVGFNTTANWQHVKLSQVTFHWLAPEGSSTIFAGHNRADHEKGTPWLRLLDDATEQCPS